MDLLTGIESRTSAAKLIEPAPTREHIERIIGAGARAPDHGRLRPWRFVVLQGEARRTLADAMADLLRRKNPEATAEDLDGERRKPMRAPTIVVVAAHITKGKIPEIEQVLAVGAAVQNMMLAAGALGYGAMWKTGGAAYDAGVKQALGLAADDHIVAFLYLGTTAVAGPLVPAPTEGSVRWL
ncbi:MAG TPA: nitroreductase [Povalibacter sp.]|uniref:nitroreductase family protein n=1 Tax=Povalibacter sp. TaxID=1962978 RepID=UPI002BEFB6F6|nr:nitroreductase [Povalibacter sp.]HMN43991.1 nitroreductase [Povalibacter sp.]